MNRYLLGFGVLICALFSFADDSGYSIEIRGAPVGDIVRLLAEMNETNIVMVDQTEGVVTASFPEAKLDSALDAILASLNLGLVKTGTISRVATRKDMEELGDDLRTETISLKYAKGKNIAPQVKDLLSKRGAVMVDDRTNSVSVRDSRRYLHNIMQFVSTLDRPDQQVLIEARIVEVNTNFARDVGLKWGVSASRNGVKVGGLANVGKNEAQTRSSMANMLSAGLQGTGTAGPAAGMAVGIGEFLDIQLALAESRGNATILSRPSIVTANNEAAQIHSGVTFYVQPTGGGINVNAGGATGTAGGTSGLEKIVAGITMDVTPQISPDNTINLAINVIESAPDFIQAVNNIPAIIDNSAMTSVLLRNGETTVIGGLFQAKKSKTRKGIPFLMDLEIPILGALFSSDENDNSKKELLIFLTPTIVNSPVKNLEGLSDVDPVTLDRLEFAPTN